MQFSHFPVFISPNLPKRNFIAAAQRGAARVLGAVLGAGLAAFGVRKLKEKREAAAAVVLYETLAGHPDIGNLTAEEVKAIGDRFDVNLAARCGPEVRAVYDTFIESVIPVKTPLR